MNINKNKAVYFALAIFVTLFWAVGMRFLLVDKESVHYHANFAVYIDGSRDKLESFTFYEEVSACSLNSKDDPKSRVHLHDQNPYVAHVHDYAATWSHLFANLGYGLTDRMFMNDEGALESSDDKKLRFILNGQQVNYVANKLIKSEDVLLIDYSASSESTVLQRYNQIPKNAGEYNQKQDPAACSGQTAETFIERLKRTLGF